jgi:16S rRNA (uracil1498-N3)-methyltransferase
MAVHDFRSQRLFVDTDLNEGTVIEASREQANYLLNVLRAATGSHILLFNGRDGEWQARIEAKGRKKCDLIVERQIRPQPARPELVYCFAPLKQARLDYMVQKAVEMGAGVLQPVITEFTQIRQVKDHRIRTNAIEAAEQCGILSLPVINEPVRLNDIGEMLGDDMHLVFCDEDASGENGIEKLKNIQPSRLALLIGPEGGFSKQEREFLRDLDRVIVLGLGPRIMRADTAAIAALAVIQASIGDWYK